MRPPSASWVRTALAIVALLVVGHLGDQWAFAHLANPGVAERDWGRLLRVTGFFPTWLVIGVGLMLQEASVGAGSRWFRRRGARLVASAALAGLASEAIKLLVRRERPGPHDGAYVFRAFIDDPWKTGGLGFPSGHAAVAFGAAFALARCFPRSRWVWLLLAAGCGYTRLAAQAHFLSDVAGGLLVGWAAALLVDRTLAPRT